jgi:hypothetical protein
MKIPSLDRRIVASGHTGKDDWAKAISPLFRYLRGGVVHVRVSEDRAYLGGQAVTVFRGELVE